jgi:deoxycytidylate deaminase
MELSEKFIKKYMRQAKHVADENTSCYSRHLAVVLVKVYEDERSRIVGTGYNGPPAKTPHCDSREYLREIIWPQLKETEKINLLTVQEIMKADELASEYCKNQFHADAMDREMGEIFADKHADCKACPRKIIGCKTGERVDLCSCQHAERNAIYNSTEDLDGCYAFCWCGVPCTDCAGALINKGIKKIYIIEDGSYAHGNGADYSFSARWLLRKKGIELIIHPKEYYLEGEV